MDRLWKDASRCYKEALEIEPEHEVARERIHQIRIMLSQQVCCTKCIYIYIFKDFIIS